MQADLKGVKTSWTLERVSLTLDSEDPGPDAPRLDEGAGGAGAADAEEMGFGEAAVGTASSRGGADWFAFPSLGGFGGGGEKKDMAKKTSLRSSPLLELHEVH